MKKRIIGIIGGGNMGEALIKGLAGKKLFVRAEILVCEADGKRAQKLKERYGIGIRDLNTVIAQASVVILAVKPQDMEIVLSEIVEADDKLFVSIAAGLTTKYFEKRLRSKARVVRAMPNMPALINEGITGICKGQYATNGDLEKAQEILSTIGEVVHVNESMMDAMTAVSGSGPAYVFLFVEEWINAAIELGFKEAEAKQLVYKILLGSARLLEKNEFNAAELRAKVTSKGGTTEAAMKVFEENNFGKLMKDVLMAAKKRAGELAK